MKHSFSSPLPVSKKSARLNRKDKKAQQAAISESVEPIPRKSASEINLPSVEASLKSASYQLKTAILTKEEQEALVSYLLEMEITRFQLLADRHGNRLEKYLENR